MDPVSRLERRVEERLAHLDALFGRAGHARIHTLTPAPLSRCTAPPRAETHALRQSACPPQQWLRERGPLTQPLRECRR